MKTRHDPQIPDTGATPVPTPTTDDEHTVNILCIGGLGDTASAFSALLDRVASHPHSCSGFLEVDHTFPRRSISAITLGDLCALEQFTLDTAVEHLADYLGRDGSSTHLVGVSAGAMVALRYASLHRVQSLFLSAPQLKPPRALITLQNAFFTVMPGCLFTAPGLSKRAMIATSRQLGRVNLTKDATRISAPTTITCGSRDPLNLGAAQLAHTLIEGSRLRIVKGAAHEWHSRNPEKFAHELDCHLSHLPS